MKAGPLASLGLPACAVMTSHGFMQYLPYLPRYLGSYDGQLAGVCSTLRRGNSVARWKISLKNGTAQPAVARHPAARHPARQPIRQLCVSNDCWWGSGCNQGGGPVDSSRDPPSIDGSTLARDPPRSMNADDRAIKRNRTPADMVFLRGLKCQFT